MSCPLCRTRPPRRACPAIGHEICPVCCGTKRLVEIQCPDSCPYLSAAKAHPAASVRKQQERDAAQLAPALAGLTEPQQQLFLLTVTLVDRFRGEGLEAAYDTDVADAAGALASTYETAARGLIYDQRPSSLPAQRLATEIRAVYDQLGKKRPSAFAADAAVVTRRLEERVAAVGRQPGSPPRAFLELASRLARLLRPDGRHGQAPGQDAPSDKSPSPIIVP